MSKRKNRYGKSCRITRQLCSNKNNYDKIVAEVVYDYGTVDEPRGYKLRVYLTEKNSDAVADNGRALMERQIGHYTYQFCKIGWQNARKTAGSICSKVFDELLKKYEVKQKPLASICVGGTIVVGNLAFIDDDERQERSDYSEKSLSVKSIDETAQRYICEMLSAKTKYSKPTPVFMRFSNDLYITKCYNSTVTT